MRFKRLYSFLLLLTTGYLYAQNPVIKHPFTADPTIRQFSDGRFYLYGSHDKDQAGTWDMEDYHVFSSDDLVKWKDHGVVLHNRQTPWEGPFWAPDAIEYKGKYYLYFPEGNHIGVAVSNSPTGPFENPQNIYKMPEGYAQAYDPTIFLYQGNHYLIISERKNLKSPFYPVFFTLKENMVEIEPGSKTELPPMERFHEGPFLFERKGKFYLVSGGHATLRYYMADSLKGPYSYKGDFFSGNETFTVSRTAHGSVLSVNDQFYLAYHYDVFPGGPYQRTTGIEYLYFNPDGTIQPVTPTRTGILPVKTSKSAGPTAVKPKPAVDDKTSQVKTPRKPNVVVILTDDMGYGEISCYNSKQVRTPEIDRLASDGVRFTDFYAPTPYCAPSRASLLTGRFPLRHKMLENPAPDAGINDIGLAASETTLAELFRRSGYRTQCIGKWHLGHQPAYHPQKHGFEGFYGMLYSNDMRPVQLMEKEAIVENRVNQRLLTQLYTNKALQFIERNKQEPFFLYLAHAMPHKPLAASPAFFTEGDDRVLYESVLRELDWSTGEIMRKLESLQLLEETIVVFLSDNGPWYGGNTGGFTGMKATNWEGGTRVPCIIRYPKAFPKSTVVHTPCWSPDLLPTLMGLTDIPTDPSIQLDGQDLRALMQGKSKDHGPIFTMKGKTIRTIRQGKWKLFVEKPESEPEIDLTKWKDERAPDLTSIFAPFQQSTPARYPGRKAKPPFQVGMLFDLEKDPAETTDVSAQYPEVKQALLKQYQQYLQTF